MKKTDFSTLPTISISRSKFNRTSQHKTSFNLGEIIPIYVDEVLPGDTRSIDIGSLVRMSNPIAPIMDNIYLDYYAFFVPNRLVWDDWKKFMGENESTAGIMSEEVQVPVVNIDGLTVGSIADHFGLPISNSDITVDTEVSALPGRGYALIYNRWFRDQNLIAPLVINKTSSYDDSDYNILGYPLVACKKSDYFTRALPYAQKGAPVMIPIGTTAPVFAGDVNQELVDNISEYNNVILAAEQDILSDYRNMRDVVVSGFGTKTDMVRLGYDDGQDEEQDSANRDIMMPVNLYADLTKATSATINNLRFAFQYQKMLERDALYGTRYWEILKAHFNVTAPDASLQDPEFLGSHTSMINIQQVIQTTGIDQETPASNELGKVAANSVTADRMNLFTKSFVEHGYIFILAVARQAHTYGQGIEKHWLRRNRIDYYDPLFANLGAQEVKNVEIVATDDNDVNNGIFGYQEAWAEYRYKPSKVTGVLNPSVVNSLGYWTLADNYAEVPTLSESFILETRSNLARALSTGLTGPDFIADFAFRDIAVRPMPMYSIPGLIDHH